jgi:serine/threonine protein kinase
MGPSAAPKRILPAGTRLGRYTLDRLLARGGMAELYLARIQGMEGFEKFVALKLVLPHLADDPSFLEMFLNEARLASRLDHPSIAQVLDLGQAEGEHFMAMEYVHGRNVRDILTEAEGKVRIGLEAALWVVLAACRGLHYAHELTDDDGQPLGIVHRDVSPSNLLVRYDGEVKLVDFGIAKAANRSEQTRTGVLKGKSGYMSPEQCRGESLDRRSDIFGLGILLYELTTAQRCFYGDNEFAVLNKIVDGEFDRPSEVLFDYPASLENIVLRALDPRVENRFPTALAMQEAIEDFARHENLHPDPQRLIPVMRELFGEVPPPTAARPIPVLGSSGPLTSSIRRRRGRRAALGLGIAGSCIAVAGYLVGTAASSTREPTGEPAAAEVQPTKAEVQPAFVPVPVPAPAEPVAAEDAVPEDEVSEDEPEAVEESRPPPEASSSAKKTKRRRGSRRKASKPKRKPAPGQTPDSMMPRE